MLPDPKLTPPLEAAPGLIFRMLAPMLEMVFRMAAEEPAPISIMAMTDPTPITIPRVVSMARMGLRRRALQGGFYGAIDFHDGPPASVSGRPVIPEGWRDRRKSPVHDHAVVDADDPFRVQGNIGVMGHQDDGDAAPFIEFTEHGENFLAGTRVQVARGFIGEEHRRTVDQRPGDGHPLLLPAGKLGRLVIHPISQPHQTEHDLGPEPGLPLGKILGRVGKGHGHVFQSAGTGQEIKTLEDEADLPVSHLGTPVGGQSDISWPSSQYSPEVGRSRQPRMCIRVLFPDPEAPIRATRSPRETVSETPLSTGTVRSPRW